jgi:hypothetical protein
VTPRQAALLRFTLNLSGLPNTLPPHPHAAELQLRSVSARNGKRMRMDTFADRVINHDPKRSPGRRTAIVAEIHDDPRGVNGALDKAVNALRLLFAPRKRNPARCTKSAVDAEILGAVMPLAIANIGSPSTHSGSSR